MNCSGTCRNWANATRRTRTAALKPPSPAQIELLQAIANGLTLKSHRDLEGRKEYRLHTPAGQSTRVAWDDVATLRSAGLIDSNQKFPSATYWLTEAGRAQLKLT